MLSNNFYGLLTAIFGKLSNHQPDFYLRKDRKWMDL